MEKENFSNVYEMKDIPFMTIGSFDWLLGQNQHDEHIGIEKEFELEKNFSSLSDSANQKGILIPEEFQHFILNKQLYSRVRSVTDCYLDIPTSFLPLGNFGHFAQFLVDSQGCFFWYLFIENCNKRSRVLLSTDFFTPGSMDYELEDIHESNFAVEANSFEDFVCRFWLENEILFAKYDETEPPNVGEKYLKLYSS